MGSKDHELFGILFDLERRLLDPAVRSSPTELEALLEPNFFEFGASGKVWSRTEVTLDLPNSPATQFEPSNFKGHRLASDVVLITYKIRSVDHTGAVSNSLRSSIWKNYNHAWQLFFHQGTHSEAP